MACCHPVAGGVLVDIRLTPKSARDAIEGIGALSGGREVLVIRVRALPEDGAANQALSEILAKALRLPKSAVSVVAGHHSRLKQVRISGNASELAAIIAAWPRSG
jgi:uncharacterized protein (TIGR00251 family)